LILITLCLLLTERSGRGTITSITLTPANPTTMSNALGYYLAGKAYVFTVNVVDPDVTAWNQITDVRITIANAPNIVVRNTAAFGFGASPLAADTAFAVTVDSGTVNASGLVTAGSTYNNFTAQFTITFRWDTPESAWAAARNVIGSATTNNPAVNTLTDTRLVSYGVVSTIRIVGFAQSDDAADGRVNPWHMAFNVTGTIAYNIPGATTADAVNTITPGEIVETNLYRWKLSVFSDTTLNGGATETPSINIPDNWFASLTWAVAAGDHRWYFYVNMTTAGEPAGGEPSANYLAINCDRIRITNIRFLGGGGVNPPPRYYRSVNLPGTQVEVTARMEDGGGPMVGNTTIRVGEYDEADNPTGATSDVVIANGQFIGVAALTYPLGAATPAGDTTPLRYGAIRVFGGSYDGAAVGAVGQYIDDFVPLMPSPIRITQPAYPTYIIYWDNEDPPGDNGAEFTPFEAAQPTATSLTFTWTALDPMTHDDHDFYSYRIYYRENGTLPWITIDRNTAGFAALANIATNTASIQGLVPLTTYDYFISAVDVFGNEVYILSPASVIHGAPGPNWGEVQTLALSILAEITDGTVTYPDISFTNNSNPSARPVRATAIRVKFHISGTADTLPESVNMIIAQEPGNGDLISGGTVAPGAMPWYRISCSKTGPNIWTGYIPETNPLIAIGTDVRFIIEMIRGASITYADHNSELEVPAGFPPVNPNDYEWNFSVITPTTFQPWPTRILNNVITDKDPVAYPAYYLSEDAYVTIKVFDIKGRPVATLLDNAFRKGGQNIKEGGWRGDNKSNRKLGVGLYYVQIEAKAVSSGRVILNSFQKVVMAR